MADDTTKRGPADAKRINVNEPWELKYWTAKLGVSAVNLRRLVRENGVMVADVQKAIAKEKKKKG